MLDDLDGLSRSADWEERCRAGTLAAEESSPDFDALILRLLRDENDLVTEMTVDALLGARHEAAMPLILRSLGSPDAPDTFDEPAQIMFSSLSVAAAIKGLRLQETIVSALQTTTDHDELLGAMSAALFFSSYGFTPIWPDALEAIQPLADHGDRDVRDFATEIVTTCAASDPDLPNPPTSSEPHP